MPIPLGFFATAGAGGAGGSAFELISTQVLTSSASSVTFSSIPATYKHLQLRMVARTTRAADVEPVNIQFNGDTASNYVKYHRLGGNGSTVTSDTEGDGTFIQVSQVAGANANTSNFGFGIVDILDYTGNKNKTTRAFMGISDPDFSVVNLMSGLWESTATISSVAMTPATATNFVSGSRFSLYGVRG